MVTGDSQEEVIIFRDKQTDMHHNIYIIIIIVITILHLKREFGEILKDNFFIAGRRGSEAWASKPGY